MEDQVMQQGVSFHHAGEHWEARNRRGRTWAQILTWLCQPEAAEGVLRTHSGTILLSTTTDIVKSISYISVLMEVIVTATIFRIIEFRELNT